MPNPNRLAITLRAFLAGIGVSIAGTLPISPVNLTLLQVGISAGVKTALWFAAGMALIEILFIRLSLGGLSKVLERTNVRRLLNRIILLLLVLLALFSFYTAFFEDSDTSGVFAPKSQGHGLLSGALFRLLNPGMILYWLGANATLLTRRILRPTLRYFNVYTIGCMAGICISLAPYVYGGAFLADYLQPWHTVMHLFIGCFFLAVAAWIVLKQNRRAPEV